MGKRHKAWARRARARLLLAFGGKCVACGSTEELQFDCIRPMGSKHHAYDTSQRISFYRDQARRGNLQILCRLCNAIKGDTVVHTAIVLEPVNTEDNYAPF